MLPSSHLSPMNSIVPNTPIAEGHLTDAFSNFIAAADRLERSHWQLSSQVTELRAQLEQRNRALASSMAENEQMRTALQQILDSLPCGVVVVDPIHERIVWSNPEGRRLLDLSIDKPPVWSSLSTAIRTMLHHDRGETWKQGDEHDFYFEDQGKERCVTVGYSAMGERAAKSRVVLTCRDTTAFKGAERQREESRNLVALAEMATVLAHEVRNPLGSLELLAGLLAGDSALSHGSKQCVEHLQAGVRSLSAVVNNVLRFHSGGSSNLKPTKLSDALRTAVNFVQPLARQTGVLLTSQLTLGATEIAADATELQQVILNLVCNALRHTPVGGLIRLGARLECKSEKQIAIVEVADGGSGIRAEDLPHVFEAGFTTTRQSPGLGLTVCQRIVEQHHGTITATSELGKGSTFRMEFPIL